MNGALKSRQENLQRTHKTVPGGAMSAVHFGPIDQPVRIVMLNANGFHGLAYRTVLEPLGVHAIGLDLRGHGHTDLAAIPGSFSNFHPYAADVIAYLRAHMDGPVVLAGHSLGASTAILAASAAPELVSKVITFDPIILPKHISFMMRFARGRLGAQKALPLARAAGRRHETFDSFETAYNHYHGRGPFKDFPDEALWDYVSGGFIQEDNHVRLACARDWEQFTYTAQSHNLKTAIKTLPQGSQIMITDFVKKTAGGSPKIAHLNKNLTVTHLPEVGHFFPITNPEIAIEALKSGLA